jgi:hypothetical protein
MGAPAMIHRTIRHLDGRPFATAGFTHDGGDISAWIKETVAAECECHPDDVTSIEADDGWEIILADGLPVYKV